MNVTPTKGLTARKMIDGEKHWSCASLLGKEFIAVQVMGWAMVTPLASIRDDIIRGLRFEHTWYK